MNTWTRTHRFGDALATAVFRPYRGEQPVVGAVSKRNRIGFIGERHHREHGSKDLLTRERAGR